MQRANEVFEERYTFNTMIAGVMEAMNALNEQVEKEGMRAFAEKRKPNYTKY